MTTLLERDFVKTQLGEYGLDPSLRLYLPLWLKDARSGQSFMSSDAYGHLCTVIGASWTPQGRTCDGDDYISVNSVAAGGFFGGAYTLIIWASSPASTGNRCSIAAAKFASLATDYSAITCMGGSGKIRFETLATGGGLNRVETSATYTDTAFHFFAMAVDADGKIQRAVIDGLLIGSATTNSNDLSAIDAFYIAALPFNSGQVNFWKGTEGDVWVCGVEASLAELQNIYLSTKWRYQ